MSRGLGDVYKRQEEYRPVIYRMSLIWVCLMFAFDWIQLRQQNTSEVMIVSGNYVRRHMLIYLITGDNFDHLVDSAKCFHCGADYFTLINKYLVALRLLNIMSLL